MLGKERARQRVFLKIVLGLVLAAGTPNLWAFSLDDVVRKAEALAEADYNAPQGSLPDVLRDMKFVDYQKIRFNEAKAYWRDQEPSFELDFYHQGLYFDTPVRVNEITAAGEVRAIGYRPDLFDFGDLKIDPAVLDGLGFAGLKVRYPLNAPERLDELASFLGASYFRVIGAQQVYGLSARGLAIDTALPSGEEFPRFREFWVEYPQPGQQALRLYALLDSPRATGAYSFLITPGADTRVDVRARIFFRDQVGRLGIAPLTSMFLFGPHQPSLQPNYRPAIHDSNGLLIRSGGEQIWRPLNNPKRLGVSSFAMTRPEGFGLFQRGRAFAQFQDLDERYDKRPSGWVEPLSDWGPGQVMLVEIPTPNETNDNIVAFWSPEQLPAAGDSLDLDYRLHFTLNEANFYNPQLAWVQQTRYSIGDVRQPNLVRQPDGTQAYIVDFVGGPLTDLPAGAEISPHLTLSDNAELAEASVRPNPVSGGQRLRVRFRITDDSRPVELRATLNAGERVLTETLSFQLPVNVHE